MRVWPGRPASRLGFGLEHVEGDFAFVDLGVGDGEGDGQSGGGAHQVQAQPPEVAGVRWRSSRSRPSRRGSTVWRWAGSGRTRRGSSRSARCRRSTRRCPRRASGSSPAAGDRRPQPLVVAGLTRQVGEQVAQMHAGVAQPAGLGREPEQGLQHRQGDQLGVGQLRLDPDLRPPRRQFGSSFNVSSTRDVQCSREGVQVGVHETSKVDGISNADRGRPRSRRRGPSTLGIGHLGIETVIVEHVELRQHCQRVLLSLVPRGALGHSSSRCRLVWPWYDRIGSGSCDRRAHRPQIRTTSPGRGIGCTAKSLMECCV